MAHSRREEHRRRCCRDGRLQQDPRAGDRVGRLDIFRFVAEPVAAWHEDHRRRRQAGDEQRVVEGTRYEGETLPFSTLDSRLSEQLAAAARAFKVRPHVAGSSCTAGSKSTDASPTAAPCQGLRPTLHHCSGTPFGRCDQSLTQAAKVPTSANARNGRHLPFVIRCKLQEETMDKSVGQARWLLAPVFAIAVAFMVIGVSLG